jgi:hypothetical protein
MEVVNWRMVKHPLNWFIVLMMLVIAAIFGHLLLTLLEQEPATRNNSPVSITGYSDTASA